MNKISYCNKCKVINKDNKKYIYKVRSNDKDELYQYLKSKDFINFLPYEDKTKDHEIYRYVEEQNLPKEDKAIELINNLAILHIKTTTYRNVDIDKTKELYETTKEQINNLRLYYLDLQDYIETKIFMSPAELLLMKNISKFYKALNYSEQKLNEWYQEKTKNKIERVVQLHNNLSLDHYLKEETSYFINWDKSKKDIVIYDFLKLFKNEYLELEMTSLFDIYQSKYKYTNEEFLLFQTLLSIPPKLTFKKTNYINTIDTKNKLKYIDITNEFLSKYYKENQSENN